MLSPNTYTLRSPVFPEDESTIRTPVAPPVIPPLDSSIVRPQWSVMIPVYNCIGYIEECINSVIKQNFPPDQMQIEVIDDCSTDGDVEQLVKRYRGRVSYFRQCENKGSLRNFETCINRSRGTYVHILHGDDKVRTGFYRELQRLFAKYPDAGAAFSDFEFIDEEGFFLYKDQPVMQNSGLIENWLEKIATYQRVQPPSMVIKRSVYEHLGSYFGVHYGEDWEMYVRIAAHYPVAHSVKYLAEYRVHGSNITSKSLVTGQNVRDISKVISVIKHYLPEEKRNAITRKSKKHFSKYFATLSDKIYHDYGNPRAAIKQAQLALMLSFNSVTIKYMIKSYIKYLIRYKASSIKSDRTARELAMKI